jgi:hypothetical protein
MAERGVLLPARHVVGWFGRLLPRAATATPFETGTPALEIVGEGVVLFCLHAR